MLNIDKIRNRIVQINDSLRTVLGRMDSLDCKLLLVYKNDMYHSLVSIGDIQRAIIKGITLDEDVIKVLRENIRVGSTQHAKEYIKEQMLKYRMEFFPVVENGELVEIYFWDELINDQELQSLNKIDAPVVIMAGGKGQRLQPITNIIPKPLIPLGDKPILQLIMESFARIGVNDFHISVNYKREMIQRYFEEVIISPTTKLNYFQEDKPLGTAGSLHLLKGVLTKPFFVSNCDILIKQDYSEILKYHIENRNELTVVAAIKHYSIPYGTIIMGKEGLMEDIKEKPTFTYMVNAGMYILEPKLLDEIPNDEIYHITHLMEKIKNRNGRVGVFPVSEGSWMDVGEWEEYNKTSRKMGFSEMKF